MLINVCRVCGKSTLCPKALELFKVNNQETLRRIYIITGIRLQQIPGAPDMVCFCCQTDLKSAMLFRRKCIQEQKKWVPMQKEAEAEEENLKAEEQALRAEEYDSDTIPRKTGRRRGPVEPLHTVDIVIDLPENAAIVESTSGENDTETEQLVEIPQDGENETEPEYSIPFKQQVHKCGTCGVVKNNKATLVRHEYTHTGERPFPCKECPKSFLSANELRAHMLSHHTTEPPFPCRYCDRRYFSVVGRKKHERVHTNERPFVCDQCGKAFTRVCILKAHMQSHTGQRMFRCDICDRSFTLKKHLVTHYISNTHKRNAEMAEADQTEEDNLEAGPEPNENFTEYRPILIEEDPSFEAGPETNENQPISIKEDPSFEADMRTNESSTENGSIYIENYTGYRPISIEEVPSCEAGLDTNENYTKNQPLSIKEDPSFEDAMTTNENYTENPIISKEEDPSFEAGLDSNTNYTKNQPISAEEDLEQSHFDLFCGDVNISSASL